VSERERERERRESEKRERERGERRETRERDKSHNTCNGLHISAWPATIMSDVAAKRGKKEITTD
jgi:hypothetical protein